MLVNGGIEPVLKMKVGTLGYLLAPWAILPHIGDADITPAACMCLLPCRRSCILTPPRPPNTPLRLQAGVYQRWRVIQTGYKRYLDMQVGSLCC